jgi:hypothetical protein
VDGRLDAVTDDGELVGRGEGFWINDHHFSRREMEKENKITVNWWAEDRAFGSTITIFRHAKWKKENKIIICDDELRMRKVL